MGSAMYESSSVSVQELAKENLLSVPHHFICLDQEPPIFSQGIPTSSIPVIDMGSLTIGEANDLEMQKLHSACKEWGIFQLVNHGVNSSLVEKLRYEVEEFYKLPLEEKMRYKARPGDVEGYGKSMLTGPREHVDWADRFYMMINPISIRKPHLFPELPSSLRETLEAYTEETQKIAMNLLKLMGEALKIQKEMKETFEDGLQSVRMTYYPPCPQPELVMGIQPHSDATGLTILFQANEVEGLQVRKDGIWIPVKILPDAFVVNVGDVLEILSNGAYKSIEHSAAVNSVKERISVAMFFNAKLETEIGPATCLLNKQNPPLFKRVKLEKYLKDFFSHKLSGKSFVDEMKI